MQCLSPVRQTPLRPPQVCGMASIDRKKWRDIRLEMSEDLSPKMYDELFCAGKFFKEA